MMDEKRTVRRRVCAIVLLGCATIVSIGGASRVSWTRPIDAWLATVPSENRPVSWAALPSLYPDVPVEENAGLVYAKCLPQHIDSFHPFHQWAHPRSGVAPAAWEPIPGTVYDALATSIGEHAPMLDVLHATASLPRSRYPGPDLADMYGCPLGHLSHLPTVVRLEAWRIALCAEQDAAATALEAVKDGLAVGRSLAGEPWTMSQMNRWACDRNILGALPRLLSRAHVTDEQLQALAECIASLEYTEGMRKAVLAELSFTLGNHAMYSGLTQRASHHDIVVDIERAVAVAGFGWWNAFGLSDVDAAQCAGFTDWLLRLSRSAPFGPTNRERPLNSRLQSRTIRFTALGLHSLDESLASFLTATRNPLAVKHVALTAIAMERYWRANHSFPTTLDGLVPAFLPQLLFDPIDERPLRYVCDNGGYRIYSVGNNRRDDGGRTSGSGEGMDDIVWNARPVVNRVEPESGAAAPLTPGRDRT